MDRKRYTAADLTALTFEESVRKRTGMYFGVALNSLDLPTRVLRRVIDDALHPVGGGPHRAVDVEVTGDLRLTMTDDQPPLLDPFGEPEPGFYESLIDKNRWLLAAAAAVSSRTLIQVRAGGRGWRQELTGTIPTRPEPFPAPSEADGTRVKFEFDARLLAPGAVISPPVEQLQVWANDCTTCSGPPRAIALKVQDRRGPEPPAPLR
jgi:hypothetical protein